MEVKVDVKINNLSLAKAWLKFMAKVSPMLIRFMKAETVFEVAEFGFMKIVRIQTEIC